jgi:hypothetical protein
LNTLALPLAPHEANPHRAVAVVKGSEWTGLRKQLPFAAMSTCSDAQSAAGVNVLDSCANEIAVKI